MLKLTVIIPAHNEEGSIAQTLESLQRQTRKPELTLVVDDASKDGTARIARRYGAKVLKPGRCGSKAASQNAALFAKVKGSQEFLIQTDLVMTIDADTALDPRAIEEMLKAFEADMELTAACGTVIPANPDNPFTLGRLGEYLFIYGFPKLVQSQYASVFIVSGCFGAYRTARLRRLGGWQTRTLTEDMDLTATMYARRLKVTYVPKAICHPIEPYNYRTFSAQVRRWSAGFVQNLALHRRDYAGDTVGIFVSICFLDAVIGGLMFCLIPLLFLFNDYALILKWYLLGDLLPISALVIFMGWRLKVLRYAIPGILCIYLIRPLNAYFFFEAIIKEWILGIRATEYVKGH